MATILSIFIGKYSISIKEIVLILKDAVLRTNSNIEPMKVNVVLGLRLPRVLAAILVGMALSISGVCFQGVFNNPLVSPDFLGVSQGACIGAAIGILFSHDAFLINVFAFLSGIASVVITMLVSQVIKFKTNITMVLAGIIVGTLMSSVLGFIKFVADPATELASITYWTMGSFSYVDTKLVTVSAALLIVCFIVLYRIAWKIDVLAVGEDEARVLGLNVSLIRNIVIVCSTLITATAICLAGTIGWVGLIIPHFARILVGSSNKKLLPVSALAGGVFMIIVDTLTRTVGSVEMPVSILTGFIGAPVFLLLLYVKRKK